MSFTFYRLQSEQLGNLFDLEYPNLISNLGTVEQWVERAKGTESMDEELCKTPILSKFVKHVAAISGWMALD